MTRPWGALLPLAVSACVWLGGGAERLERVDEADLLAFAQRIDSFYARLEKLPLDSLITFEDKRLRAYFRGEREFSDYYASLAAQVRRAQFRNSRALRIVVREFRFEGEDIAHVDVTLVGEHIRALRPGDIELRRTDVWRRSGGIWSLSPDKL